MKKTFLGLLAAAVGVWGYVVFRVVMIVVGANDVSAAVQKTSGTPSLAALLARPRPALDTAFRDPFQSYLYAQKPAPVAPRPSAAQPAKVLEPPKAVLSGILWGDEPVAILKQDGQTELVKKGAEVWGLKVIRIEKNSVVVRKQGHPFTLEY
jgi:type II secretory pathway component PulC